MKTVYLQTTVFTVPIFDLCFRIKYQINFPMTSPPLRTSCDIINLNVGGTKFSTSRQTLTQIQDTFFTGIVIRAHLYDLTCLLLMAFIGKVYWVEESTHSRMMTEPSLLTEILFSFDTSLTIFATDLFHLKRSISKIWEMRQSIMELLLLSRNSRFVKI